MNSSPTTWAELFAERHGLNVRFESPLPGRVPAYKYRDGDEMIVVLDSALPAERQHFSLAHEAAHVLLEHEGDVGADEEQDANRLAAELLLPDPPFGRDAHESLRALKEMYSHASFEAIGRRRLAFIRGVLTVVDNQSVVRRLISDDFQAPPQPVTPEWTVIEQCYQEQADVERLYDVFLIRGTFVDDGRGIARVLLYVEDA